MLQVDESGQLTIEETQNVNLWAQRVEDFAVISADNNRYNWRLVFVSQSPMYQTTGKAQ